MTGFFALALTALALALAAGAVRAQRKPLGYALALLAFGVGCVNPFIEAVAFDVLPLAALPSAVGMQLAVAVALAGILAFAFGGRAPEAPVEAPAPLFTPGRLLAVAVCYLALYMVAGMAVFPFVKAFYDTKQMPSMSLIIGLQLLRAPAYVLYAWPWLRMHPRRAGVTLGVVYAVVGGIGPLLYGDNPFMPAYVRMAHMIEVGISNFLFGLVAVRILRPRTSSPIHRETLSAS